MVTKKTDLKKPSKTSSFQAPEKKAVRAEAGSISRKSNKSKEGIQDLKAKIAELERGYAHEITVRKDIETEFRLAEISLRKERDFVSAILSTAGALVIVLDVMGRILNFNKACEQITGYSFHEVEGKPFWDFLLVPEEVAPVKSVFRNLRAGQFPNRFENYWVSKDGTRHLISWSNTALLDDNGEVEFIVGTGIDLTGMRKAEYDLSQNRSHLTWVLEKTGVGTWLNELPLGNLNWDAQTRRLFFIPPEADPTIDLFWSRLHPDDREPTRTAVEKAIRERTLYEIDHRAVNPETGEVRWIRSVGRATYARNGTPARFDGVNYDITDRKKAEDDLRIALGDAHQRQKEIFALLQGSKAVLQYSNFDDAARVIFNACKDVIGATSGYIAMVSDDGTRNEVIFLDSGGMICTVDPNLPMPLRGLRGEVYSSGNAIFHNDFLESKWSHFLPEGHLQLENVLMAPMIVNNNVVGLFGLGNKRGGFTDNDVRIASAFSELAAITLVQKRAEGELIEAKSSLKKANDELGNKVLERTAELTRAYHIVESEHQRLFSVLEQLPGYVCLITADYKFTYVNQEFKNRFGDPGDRLCHEYLFNLQNPCENCQTFKVFTEQKLRQWEWTGPDGRTYAIFDYPFNDIDGSAQILELGIDITRRKKAEEELHMSREKLRNLYAHLQTAVETERKNIAREIHDEFGTILTALNIDLSWLKKNVPADQFTLVERIKKDLELTNAAIKMVQRIASELRPSVLDYLGFSSAVEWQVKEFAQRAGIDWDISIDTLPTNLDKESTLALFRILQETLTNIARHAEASKIEVSVSEAGQILTLTVTDNGRGIRDEHLSDPHSYGIMGIKERVEYLGGNVHIIGVPDKGTTVKVRLPIAGRESKNDQGIHR